MQQWFGSCLIGWCTAVHLEMCFSRQLQMVHLSTDSGEQEGPALLTPLVFAAKRDRGETAP